MKMCQGFVENNVDTTLIVPDALKQYPSERIYDHYSIKYKFPIERFKLSHKPGKLTQFALKSVLFVKKKEGDVIIYSRNAKVAIWASLLFIPFIIELHDKPKTPTDNLSIKLGSLSKHLITFVVISKALKKKYRKLGYNGDKFVVLPDAVDLNAFPAPQYFKRKCRNRISLGYAGHLYQGRGIDLILDIAERLRDLKFFVIGGTDELIQYWKKQLYSKNIDNVIFTGFVPNRDIPEKLMSTDILLMPYQRHVAVDGNRGDTSEFMSPMKMFEYMATGKPIISSDLPVLKEIMIHGKNAILVHGDSPDLYAESINGIIQNPDLGKKIGEEARYLVEKKFNWTIRALTIKLIIKNKLGTTS
jgi:glycosyltransferase involved in cell wall biosynthesis